MSPLVEDKNRQYGKKRYKKRKEDKKVILVLLCEIGFIVTHIDENGFIFFTPWGLS